MYQNRITLFQRDRQFYNYEDAAQELFGVADATGLFVTMDGHTYQVLGMLTREIQGVVFSAKDLHATRLDHITIETSENSTLSMLEQAVEWKIGFAGTAFDYRFINSRERKY